MKQQWSTLQTALNNQKEVNIKLILKDAKKRVSWNRGFLRTLSIITLFLTVPYCIFILQMVGVPQPIYVALALLLAAAAANALFMSFIIKTPNDSSIDVVKYSKCLVRFKKHYLWSEAVGSSLFITIIIWAITSMGFSITNPMVIGAIIGGSIGVAIGVSLSIKVLNNIKELQGDIDLIEGMKE